MKNTVPSKFKYFIYIKRLKITLRTQFNEDIKNK